MGGINPDFDHPLDWLSRESLGESYAPLLRATGISEFVFCSIDILLADPNSCLFDC